MFSKTTFAPYVVSILFAFTAHTAIASEMGAPTPSNQEEAEGQQNADALLKELKAVKSVENLHAPIQIALNQIVAEGIAELNKAGQTEMAQKFESEWNQNFSETLLNRDLGDHKPLNEWLGYFCKALKAQLGVEKMKATRLYDLMVLNFGIPVALNPQGNELESWDKLEYSKHFVPLFGTMTYWGSMGVCLYIAQTQAQIKPFCKKAAAFAEKLVVATVALKVSDMVYDKANNASYAAY
ncbi:MAG: hypothetical protein V4736_04790 [Bdellovibrionota bacterium]